MRRANAAPNWRRISDHNRNQENEEGKELKNDFVILSNDLSISIIYSFKIFHVCCDILALIDSDKIYSLMNKKI